MRVAVPLKRVVSTMAIPLGTERVRTGERPSKSPMKGDLDIPPYDLKQRLERFVYLGDDRQIMHRFCQGKEILF